MASCTRVKRYIIAVLVLFIVVSFGRFYIGTKLSYIVRNDFEVKPCNVSILYTKLRNIEKDVSIIVENLRGRKHLSTDNSAISSNYAIATGVIDPRKFRYRINRPRDICKNNKFSMFIYIHSAVVNFKRRALLRKTWANREFLKKLNVGHVFITGTMPNDTTTMRTLEDESNEFSDIVQTVYIDTYPNITIKSTSALNWAAVYCAPHVPVILKSDDDIFINMTRLMDYVKNDLPTITSGKGDKLILCNLWKNEAVVRDPSDRYYIPKELYSKPVYPPFCQGSALIMTSRAVMAVREALFGTRLYPLDDVFLTGFTAPRAGVSLIAINERHLTTLKVREVNNQDLKSPFFFVHTNVVNFVKLWAHMPKWTRSNTIK